MLLLSTCLLAKLFVEPKQNLDSTWWQRAIIYQIYPRSFCDSTGTGIGDLRGIITKLDYIKDLGVECVWLNPIYKSPMLDNGYDVADFCSIDPLFGTMQDFDDLIEQLHKRNINLLMDFVPNHTSYKHRWFEESRKSKSDLNPYKNYYIWSDGKRGKNGEKLPPNNWVSVFGGSMWKWCDSRQQFYLHQFLPEMPDLNFRCREVRIEMENVLRFWLERGVDGFRIDAIKHLFESENLFMDEIPTGRKDATNDQYESLHHTLTIDQPEIRRVMESWRLLMDEYGKRTGRYRFMVGEVYPDGDTSMDTVMDYCLCFLSACSFLFYFFFVYQIRWDAMLLSILNF